jgi:sulfite reductase (ferredoxin)
MVRILYFIRSTKVTIEDTVTAYEAWKQSNVIVQKQAGYLAIGIKVTGDFIRIKAKLAADLIKVLVLQINLVSQMKAINSAMKAGSLSKRISKLDFVTLVMIHNNIRLPEQIRVILGIMSKYRNCRRIRKSIKLNFPGQRNREITIKWWLYECMQTTLPSINNWFSRNISTLVSA